MIVWIALISPILIINVDCTWPKRTQNSIDEIYSTELEYIRSLEDIIMVSANF